MEVERQSGAGEMCHFDVTGMFHWCEERMFEDCIMVWHMDLYLNHLYLYLYHQRCCRNIVYIT